MEVRILLWLSWFRKNSGHRRRADGYGNKTEALQYVGSANVCWWNNQHWALDSNTVLPILLPKNQAVLLSLLFVFKGLNWPIHFLTQRDTIQLISGCNPRPEHCNSFNDHKLYILFALKYWLWPSPEASQGHLLKIIHFRVDLFLSPIINRELVHSVIPTSLFFSFT